jgi:hypothetical protein
LVLIDGVPVFNVEKIVAFDPLKIKKLDVVTSRYFQGARAYPGIVSYQTYDGDLAGFQLDPGSLIVEYQGLQLQRQFYAPIYETPEQAASRLPDFRSLLYWSPDIKTEANGSAGMSFYTSDMPGRYIVVVQGVDEKGRCGSRAISFEVKK